MPAPAAAAESVPTRCRSCPRDSAASGRWRAARRPRLPGRAHRRCGAARSGWRPVRRLRHRGRVPASPGPSRGMAAWWRASMKGGTQAPHGNLVNSMAAVTGGDAPPRHLVVRTAAVGMVRSRFAGLMDAYARWAPATAGTDGRHVHPLRTRPVPDTPRLRARIQGFGTLVRAVLARTQLPQVRRAGGKLYVGTAHAVTRLPLMEGFVVQEQLSMDSCSPTRRFPLPHRPVARSATPNCRRMPPHGQRCHGLARRPRTVIVPSGFTANGPAVPLRGARTAVAR